MTLPEALRIVLREAEARANGHHDARRIIEAVKTVQNALLPRKVKSNETAAP